MDRKAREYERMTTQPVFGLVMGLAVPTMFSMLITSGYNLVDTFFVSSLGNAATGAVGVVYSLQSVIQAVGYGFGMGAQSLISRRLGEQKNEEADIYAASGFVAAFLIGLLILVFGLPNLAPMLDFLGATRTALPLACDYGKWILIGAPAFCSSFVLNNILRSEGRANMSMVGLCSGGILNIGLDYLFIFRLDMKVGGAALATMISQLFSFCILASFFLTKKTAIRVNPLKTSRRLSDYILIFRTGLPTVFRQSLGSVATAMLNVAVRPYGDAAMSAVSIVNKIYMLLRSMLVGMGQGFQPVAGYNYGAKLYDRVRRSFRAAIIMGTAYGTAAAVILFCFAGNIIGLFRPGDTEVIGYGSSMLRYLCLPMVVLGFSTFVNQMYQCLGFVVPATFLASCRQGIFFVPLVLILPAALGFPGVQITQTAADLLTVVVSLPFYFRLMRMLRAQPC